MIDDDYRLLERIRRGEGLEPLHDIDSDNSRLRPGAAAGRSVNAEDEPAYWVPIRKGERGYSASDYRCSACGKPCPCWKLTRFCPECGRRIKKNKKGRDER